MGKKNGARRRRHDGCSCDLRDRLGFFRCAHNASWGTRADSFAGEKSHSSLVLVPYLIGGLMLGGSVMMSV